MLSLSVSNWHLPPKFQHIGAGLQNLDWICVPPRPKIQGVRTSKIMQPWLHEWNLGFWAKAQDGNPWRLLIHKPQLSHSVILRAPGGIHARSSLPLFAFQSRPGSRERSDRFGALSNYCDRCLEEVRIMQSPSREICEFSSENQSELLKIFDKLVV